MFNIVLYQPEIPPNTGNIIRLCTNTGSQLHLIEPLGFDLSDKQLKRANLDYTMLERPKTYASFEMYEQNKDQGTLYLCSTKGKTLYSDVEFKCGDSLVFGPETRGLPIDIIKRYPEKNIITIPMHPNARSLNLSNAVAIINYEAWRQQQFIMQKELK
jgi:tRNA (cytidine/uridine-2'-O-)-methyltransferase